MNGRQVVVVVGSPRAEGACAALAEQVQAGARAAGAAVARYDLHGLNIQPCTACDVCQAATDDDCFIQDDLQPIYQVLRRADALVLVSPIYWFSFSAQTKLFIDRAFYGLQGPQGNALRGKSLGLVLAYGDSDPFTSGAVNALRSFQDMCRYVKADLAGFVYGSSGGGAMRDQPAVLDQARRLGEKLGRKAGRKRPASGRA